MSRRIHWVASAKNITGWSVTRNVGCLDMVNSKSVYLAFTPFHIFVAYGLACKYDKSDLKYLIIISDFCDATNFYKALLSDKYTPFSHIIFLDGRYLKEDKWLQIFLLERKNVSLVRDFIKNMGINESFIFNDATPEGQAAAVQTSKNGGINNYVEDGIGAYMIPFDSTFNRKKTFFKKLIIKIFHGLWFEYIPHMGGYSCINKIMAFYPDLTIPKLRHKDIIRMGPDILKSVNPNLVECLKDVYNVSDCSGLYADCIIILPHSENFRELGIQYVTRFRLVYSMFLDHLKKICKHITIKYHPREPMDDYLNLKAAHPVVEVAPKSWPMELIFLTNLNHPPKFIIGDISTSLYISKLLFADRVKTISIIKAVGLADKYPSLESLFIKLGIFIPQSLEEIDAIFEETS